MSPEITTTPLTISPRQTVIYLDSSSEDETSVVSKSVCAKKESKASVLKTLRSVGDWEIKEIVDNKATLQRKIELSFGVVQRSKISNEELVTFYRRFVSQCNMDPVANAASILPITNIVVNQMVLYRGSFRTFALDCVKGFKSRPSGNTPPGFILKKKSVSHMNDPDGEAYLKRFIMSEEGSDIFAILYLGDWKSVSPSSSKHYHTKTVSRLSAEEKEMLSAPGGSHSVKQVAFHKKTLKIVPKSTIQHLVAHRKWTIPLLCPACAEILLLLITL